MNRNKKPKLSAHDLVQKLKNEKGIRFNIVSEEDAENYLLDTNNYMRTASYRKNYQKYTKGKNKGKYIDLEFAYLKDLSSVDSHLRSILLQICIDIEHDLKIQLLKDLEQSALDGYGIVETFLDKNERIKAGILKRRSSAYTADLIDKYFVIETDADGKEYIKDPDCPVWVLLEIISFGDFILFYDYFYKIIGNYKISVSLLNNVKSLRNACAHNNCLIYNLNMGNSNPSLLICTEVSKIQGISKSTRTKRLSSRFLLEYVTTLYVFKTVTSKSNRKEKAIMLQNLYDGRMVKNKDFYKNNELIKSSYLFTNKIVSNWFA